MTPERRFDPALSLARWRCGRAVGRTPAGAVLSGGTWLGGNASWAMTGYGETGDVSDSAAVSRDGSRFVYGGIVNGAPQLFLHRDGQAPVMISASQATGESRRPGDDRRGLRRRHRGSPLHLFRSFDQLTDDAPPGGADYAIGTTPRPDSSPSATSTTRW